ncbi:MAG: hypothetical protein PHH23_08740 [Paludibacteraceae bacterium]|jgi:hypothetical protein|nr:hypothetical protein [Paludibacteraceae bacterium]
MKKFDSFWLSISAGLILPVIFGYIFMKTFYHGNLPISEVILNMGKTALFTKLIIVSLLPNLFAVFITYSMERWKMCRGFFVTILLYLIISLFFI